MENIQKEYKYKIGQEVNIGNFHAVIIGYGKDKNGHMTYKYRCLKCGYDQGKKSAAVITNGHGCGCCTGRVVVKGINDITTTDPWMIPFFQGGAEEASLYTKSCKKRIVPKCPDCGRLVAEQKINNIYNHKGVSCVCKDGVSFPNKIIYFLMEQLLGQNQISHYQREYHIQEENKFYDIYFEIHSNKYFIEMDGGIGHGFIFQKHDKTDAKFKVYSSSMFRDDVIKERLAESLNIKLIRIDCYYSNFEYIKNNILNSELKDVVNLECIDWTLIENQSYSNLMKMVCDYKRNNPDVFVKDAVLQFNLNAETIRRYWTNGNKLGWCVFDRKTEDIRSRKARKYYGNSCKVIFEDIATLERIEFDSVADFVRKNSEYFTKPFTKKTIETRFKKCNNFIENYEGCNIYKLKANYKKEN